ncbi:MAG: pyridoxamine 5'-phosphate oxidase [Oscillospiraceae bacterium]|nr:pyridoxamine 5'-phosphate oxidase [Oscillospiraceae bacterium]
MRNPEKTIGRIIDKSVSSMIAYEDEDGGIDSVMRAKLTLMKRNGIKEFWLSTCVSSATVELFKSRPNALLYFYHKSFQKLVLLTGALEVLAAADADGLYVPTEVPVDYVLKFTAVKATYSTNIKSEDFSIA